MTLPKLGTILRYLPAPVWLGLAALALFAAGRCTAPAPAKPSRDSTAAAQYAKALADSTRVSARRDSVRNAALDSLLGDNAKLRAQQRQRLVVRRSEPTPPDTAPQAVAYWRGRAEGAEAALDSVLTADSVAFDSLVGLYRGQQAETAQLRTLLAGAADSLAKIANLLGEKDRRIHELESDRWSLCAAGGVGSTVGLAATPEASGPGAAAGGALLVGVCYRIW